jgi:ribose 5-phosphate isomerase B
VYKNKKKKIKKIILASDHAGFLLKEEIKRFLLNKRKKILDLGTNNTDSVDYPDYAHLLSKTMNNKNNQRGILVCGSGIGMNMVANRYKNIRCALCYNVKSAKLSREHNNANVIAIGARLTKKKVALECVNTFLNTNFKSGRHLRRLRKI